MSAYRRIPDAAPDGAEGRSLTLLGQTTSPPDGHLLLTIAPLRGPRGGHPGHPPAGAHGRLGPSDDPGLTLPGIASPDGGDSVGKARSLFATI